METLLPLLGTLFTETDSQKRRQIEAILEQAGMISSGIIIEPEKLLTLLLQVIVNPLNMESQSTVPVSFFRGDLDKAISGNLPSEYDKKTQYGWQSTRGHGCNLSANHFGGLHKIWVGPECGWPFIARHSSTSVSDWRFQSRWYALVWLDIPYR